MYLRVSEGPDGVQSGIFVNIAFKKFSACENAGQGGRRTWVLALAGPGF